MSSSLIICSVSQNGVLLLTSTRHTVPHVIYHDPDARYHDVSVDYDINFTFEPDTGINGACSAVGLGKMYVLGGTSPGQKRQVINKTFDKIREGLRCVQDLFLFRYQLTLASTLGPSGTQRV